MRLLTRLSFYEWIAFITGFVLMSYELAASRVLAPYIGSSTYVWTSVIGVMIAALACGYAVGGWLADRRGIKTDLAWLLLFAALAIVVSGLFHRPILELTTSLFGDPRVQGIFAALMLFAPASFLLGVISPYLARLRIQSLSTAGRSVAGLSACNSVGGILGTFFTGFVFFGMMGSQETLILLSAALIVTAWFVAPTIKNKKRNVVAIGTIMVIAGYVSTPALAGMIVTIDTPTSNYTVSEIHYAGQRARILAMGPSGWQSGIAVNNPNTLIFNYTKQLARVVEASPKKDHILILGGGAFTLPEYFGRLYPTSHITVVEIDPKLPDLARRYFDYQDLANVQIVTQDARTFLRTNTAHFDVIVADVFSDTSIPFTLSTEQYAASVAQSLTKQGTVAVNIIGALNEQCLPFVSSMHASYKTAFNSSRFFLLGNKPQALQNIIVVYSNGDLAWAADLPGSADLMLRSDQRLTDNFAPIERLRFACSSR